MAVTVVDRIRRRCKLMAVPVAIPHMADSRTHHRYLDCLTEARMPKASGRFSTQVAVSTESLVSFTFPFLFCGDVAVAEVASTRCCRVEECEK